MSALDHIRGLYAYNEWANGHVLEAASALNDEELKRDLGASFGSVQGNLSHALGAQALWLSRWTGTTPAPPRGDAGFATLRDGYRSSHDGLRAFVDALTAAALERDLSYTDTRGVTHQRPLWQLMAHLANHGTHHRAETALLLTALGKPPRQLDYVFFEIERAGGAPRLT